MHIQNTTDGHNEKLKSSPSKRKVFLFSGLLAVVLFAGATYYYNLFGAYAAYVYVFKTERVPSGATMYISNEVINAHDGATAILALRMIRPMTNREVEKDILPKLDSNAKVAALKIAGDPSMKPHLQMMDVFYDTGKMRKNHYFILGKYVETKVLPMVDRDSRSYLTTVYVLDPDNTCFEDPHFVTQMPVGYTYADSFTYVAPTYASTNPPILSK
jgi:hypothetical protein